MFGWQQGKLITGKHHIRREVDVSAEGHFVVIEHDF